MGRARRRVMMSFVGRGRAIGRWMAWGSVLRYRWDEERGMFRVSLFR